MDDAVGKEVATTDRLAVIKATPASALPTKHRYASVSRGPRFPRLTNLPNLSLTLPKGEGTREAGVRAGQSVKFV